MYIQFYSLQSNSRFIKTHNFNIQTTKPGRAGKAGAKAKKADASSKKAKATVGKDKKAGGKKKATA